MTWGPSIDLCGRQIGPAHRPLVIAEIGINHEGSIAKAIQMVDDAAAAGCECVKFQCHVVSDEMVAAAKEVIPGNADESIWDIMDRCSLSEDEDRQLMQHVGSKGMLYLSTPFSRAAADRLENLGVSAYKIGSGECNNYPLIEHIAGFGKPIILSTGMNDIDSVSRSVSIIHNADLAYALLHCISVYPTPYDKVRLGAIEDLATAFPEAVIGYSDHCVGEYACFAAAARGASVIEKHFTSDLSWPGPDIPLSVDPAGLRRLVQGTEAIRQALGGTKTILPEEQPTIDFAYACVVAIENIEAGELLTRENIWVKRPGTGQIKAGEYSQLLGRTARTAIEQNTQLTWDQISD